MGVPVSVVSVVGEDEYGRRMREALDAEGMDTAHLRVEPGDTSVMLMALKNGVDRVHLEAIDGVMADYELSLEDEEFVLEHDFIHTDLFGNCLRHLPAWHAAGKTVVMDFSVFSRDTGVSMRGALPVRRLRVHVLRGGRPDLRSWLERVQGLGPKVAVATLGEKGSIAYDGERFHECGIVEAESVVNTVGAATPISRGSPTA